MTDDGVPEGGRPPTGGSAEPAAESLVAQLPPSLLQLCGRLRERGYRAWVVGGSIRDLLLGRGVEDWDVATDARPEQVVRSFRRVIPTGMRHGTVTVLHGGSSFEVTTLRGEGGYADGRRPDEVVFLDDIVDDLARRDFTINAIALDVDSGKLLDPFGGRTDLAARVVRAVGRAEDRFAEDGLRMLRAARFAATLECEIEADTLAAMRDPRSLATLKRVSAERVRDEWLKSLRARKPSVAFGVMLDSGMLALHAPELVAMAGCEQNRYHAYDVWNHTMHCVDACPPDLDLRLAALLHDVGKPPTRAHSPKTDDYTFYDHEMVGATMAERMLRRLRCSNEQREQVVAIVRHHLVCYGAEWTDAAVRRWLRRVGPDRLESVLALAVADARSKGVDAQATIDAIEELRARATTIQQQGNALSRNDLAVDGHLLMRELGIAPSRRVGELLDALLELVTDEPASNERDTLLAAARQLLERAEA